MANSIRTVQEFDSVSAGSMALEALCDPTAMFYDWVVFSETLDDAPQVVVARRLDESHLIIAQYDGQGEDVEDFFSAQVAIIQVSGVWQNHVLVDRAYRLDGINVSVGAGEPSYALAGFTTMVRKDKTMHCKTVAVKPEYYDAGGPQKADAIEFDAPRLIDVITQQKERDRLWSIDSTTIRPGGEKLGRKMNLSRGGRAFMEVAKLLHAVADCQRVHIPEELVAKLDKVAKLALGPAHKERYG